jgi:VRR-NUC domain
MAYKKVGLLHRISLREVRELVHGYDRSTYEAFVSRHRVHRRDIVQAPIVEALRKMGGTFQDTSQVGGGCPDGIYGLLGGDYWVEFKSPGGKLSANQLSWLRLWRGGDVYLLESVDEAVQFVKELRVGVIPQCTILRP